MSTMKDIATRFTEMVNNWDATDVLGALNMSEGHTLAELLEAIEAPYGVAERVLRGVWLGEEEEGRDERPWVDGYGSRFTEEEYEANQKGKDIDGPERVSFEPCPDFDGHDYKPDNHEPRNIDVFGTPQYCDTCGYHKGTTEGEATN